VGVAGAALAGVVPGGPAGARRAGGDQRPGVAHDLTDSMREVLVRGDAKAALANQQRLLEAEDWGLEAAAERLEGGQPERAAEIRALVAKRRAREEAA
jgi:hypothetical protein